jgi:hypothetical protein
MAVALDPNAACGFGVKEEAYYCLEKFDEGRQNIEMAMSLNPLQCSQKMTLWYHHQVASQFFQDGAYDECLKKLNAALRIGSHYALFWDSYSSSKSMMDEISRSENLTKFGF